MTYAIATLKFFYKNLFLYISFLFAKAKNHLHSSLLAFLLRWTNPYSSVKPLYLLLIKIETPIVNQNIFDHAQTILAVITDTNAGDSICIRAST